MTDEAPTLRARLRRVPALAGDLPSFDVDDVPDDPADLFVRWLEGAIEAGVPEPHAVTVSTAGPDGPDARVVVLKDVRDGDWELATDARSAKVAQLAADPRVALASYWPAQGRQVRVRGVARRLDPAACVEDFLARSPASRAAAWGTLPGRELPDRETLLAAQRAARDRVDEPLPEWVVLAIRPEQVEFFQGDGGRAHTRLVYRRDGAAWTRSLRWP